MMVMVDVATHILYLLDDGQRIDTWPVSTGVRGTGNQIGGFRPPLAVFDIARKIGNGLPESQCSARLTCGSPLAKA